MVVEPPHASRSVYCFFPWIFFFFFFFSFFFRGSFRSVDRGGLPVPRIHLCSGESPATRVFSKWEILTTIYRLLATAGICGFPCRLSTRRLLVTTTLLLAAMRRHGLLAVVRLYGVLVMRILRFLSTVNFCRTRCRLLTTIRLRTHSSIAEIYPNLFDFKMV